MGKKSRCVGFCILVCFCLTPACNADDVKTEAPLVLLTDFTYQAGSRDSLEKTRALAAFGARRKAVDTAARELMQSGLLKDYGPQEAEIFCLAAGNIKAWVVRESYAEKERRYFMAVKAEVGIADFMEAEIENQAMEKEESAFPWKEEMEQAVLDTVDPGKEISRAYRYIRREQTRIAIIYLDHLVKKYRNWGDVYYVRSLAYRQMHSREREIEDLEKSCALDHRPACRELEASR